MTGQVAVAMATFNAGSFLDAQLRSIEAQTVRPGLLVVHDDGSTDDTMRQLSDYRRNASFQVKVISRQGTPSPDGYTRVASSFARAMWECRSFPYLALSDQDDDWRSTRLEDSVAVLRECPRASLAFSDGYFVDDNGRRLPGSLRVAYPVPDRLAAMSASAQLRAVLARPFVTGAATTLRSELMVRALPIPRYWLHDRWLSVVAAAKGGLLPVEQPLVNYRLHPGQAVGLGVEEGNKAVRAIRSLTRHGSLAAPGERTATLVRRLRQMDLDADVQVGWRDAAVLARFTLAG